MNAPSLTRILILDCLYQRHPTPNLCITCDRPLWSYRRGSATAWVDGDQQMRSYRFALTWTLQWLQWLSYKSLQQPPEICSAAPFCLRNFEECCTFFGFSVLSPPSRVIRESHSSCGGCSSYAFHSIGLVSSLGAESIIYIHNFQNDTLW